MKNIYGMLLGMVIILLGVLLFVAGITSLLRIAQQATTPYWQDLLSNLFIFLLVLGLPSAIRWWRQHKRS